MTQTEENFGLTKAWAVEVAFGLIPTAHNNKHKNLNYHQDPIISKVCLTRSLVLKQEGFG